jgi:MYXO-CTERM domain-containing protein
MNISSRFPGVAATLAVSAFLLTGSTNARADIPPPNTEQCQNKAAATSCVTEKGADGTCQQSTCAGRGVADAGDGGSTFVTTMYACAICTPNGQTVLPDGGVTTTGSSSSSGCNVASTSTSSALGFAGLAFGLALLLRKRSPSRRGR